jgi:hypothetical protein
MGLLETINSAVAVAFNAVDNLQKPIVYISKPTSTYSPTSGAVTNPNQVSVDSKAIIGEVKSNEINGISVLANDQWAIVHSGNLSVTPKESDEVVFDGVTYRVTAIKKLIGTGTIIWKIQLRARK